MKPTIREMELSDVHVCAQLIVDTYKIDGLWTDWSLEQTIDDLTIAITQGSYKEKYFVAEIDNEIVGIAGVGESFMSTDAFELCYGTVKSKYQRQGIGTLLTLKRIDYAKSFNTKGYIFVASRYPKFFEKLGFVKVMDKRTDDYGGAFCCLKY